METFQEEGQSANTSHATSGTIALLFILLALFCFFWVPAAIQRCRERSIRRSISERHSAMLRAEAELIRVSLQRLHAEAVETESALSQVRLFGTTLADRKEYVTNSLMTKRVILQTLTAKGTETKPKVEPESSTASNQHKSSNLDICHKGDLIIPEQATVSACTDSNEQDGDDDEEMDAITNSKDFVETCLICLEKYKDGDEISWSHNPKCAHVFHRNCIMEWLMSHEECPCCRQGFLSFSDDGEGKLPNNSISNNESPRILTRRPNSPLGDAGDSSTHN